MTDKHTIVIAVRDNEYDALKQPDILFDYTQKIANDSATYLEERIRFVVRRPPRWIPTSLWYQIIKRLFVIQRRRK